MLSRRGAAMAELVVAMTILGIVGAAASGALAQQGRARMRIVGRAAAEVQLREAVAPLIVDLASASPAAGDFPSGQATDTAVELRVTTGSAFVCAVIPEAAQEVFASLLTVEHGRGAAVGDTAWAYERRTWRGRRITHVERVAAPSAGCTGENILRITLSDSVPGIRTPLRFTRRARYSLYRASDGRTYLGLREWTASTGSLSGVQPVAGPFDRSASRFRYHDTLGAEIASMSAGSQLGSVAVELQAPSRTGMLGVDNWASAGAVTIGLRNRP